MSESNNSSVPAAPAAAHVAPTPAKSSGSQGASETQVKPDSGSSPKEIASQDGKRMFKVKVNGADVEVSEDELVSGYQTRKASDEKFREAAMSRKQAEEFIHLLKTNPKKVLTDPNLGVDFRKLAEEYLVEQMQEEMMEPQERELRDAKRRLQEYEEVEKSKQKEAEEVRKSELRQKYAQDYQNQILGALQTSGLPKTEHTVKRMAYYMHESMKRGMSLGPVDVVDLVKQDYINDTKSLYGGLDADALMSILGDDIASKIRKHDVAKFKSGAATPKKSDSGSSSNTKKSEKLTKDEWREKLARIKNGQD